MNKEILKKIIELLLGIIGIIGIITFFSKDFIDNHLTIYVLIVFAVLSAIISIALYLYTEIKQNGYDELENKEKLLKRITKYANSTKYPNIFLYGAFDEEIIQTIYETSGEKNPSQSVTLISTNPENYIDLSTDLINKIFNSEAKFEDKDFSHKFFNHSQKISVFLASNNDKNIMILFWNRKSVTGQEELFGIEIRNKHFNINIDDIKGHSFSMNIEGQHDSTVIDTITEIDDLWESFNEGYFKPIIPPSTNYKIREEWRNLILQNFNKYALDLIRSDSYTLMKITWNITKESIKDYKNFQEWINNQFIIAGKDDVVFRVERYILIDKHLFKKDTDYKDSAINICKEFEDRASSTSGNYIIKYIDSSSLSGNLKNDYAYLSGESEIVQSSLIDNNSRPDVLKVNFSKNHDVVTKIKMKFEKLEKWKNKYNSIDKFSKSV